MVAAVTLAQPSQAGAVIPLKARKPTQGLSLELIFEAEIVESAPATRSAITPRAAASPPAPSPAPIAAALVPHQKASLDARVYAHQRDQEDAEVAATVFSMAAPARAQSTAAVARSRKARKIQEDVAAAEESWLGALREMMAKLKADRLSKGISYMQLHQKTQIPIYQLQLLEAVAIDRLPEPIYINGFVRRFADALGHNGKELVATLPDPNPHPENIVPEWYIKHQSVANKVQVQPVHLYVGYAALMAGALGGLQSMMQPAPAPLPALMNQSSLDSSSTYEVVKTLPTAPWEQSAALNQASMAPPERLSSAPELSP
ncbi:MAG: helix-turn-helix domain-containing protein [Prochlorothrix sp.]